MTISITVYQQGDFTYCTACKPSGASKRGTFVTSDYDHFCKGCGHDFQDIAAKGQEPQKAVNSESRATIMTTNTTGIYVQEYTNLHVACLDPEQHERTCNYWYTVTTHGATAHTAFHTASDLLKWLDERGLSLSDTLPEERGTWKSIRVEGSYTSASYLNVWAFNEIEPLETCAVMDNAQYTLGKVTEEKGVRTVHYLNVNVKERIIL
jgi:hypothetical protein